jgi:hypothetical protein
VGQYGQQRAAEVGIPVEVIIMLPGASLPVDHNSAEGNPISADYKLPEVGADTWEEAEELEQGKLQKVEV